MKKLMKCLSIAILICFAFSSVVCGVDITKSKVTLTPSSGVFYENYIGIDTPTLGQEFKAHIEEVSYNNEAATDVSIKDAGAFNVRGGESEYNAGAFKSRTFLLQAPNKEGSYKMTFEGKTVTGKTFTFSTDIKVVQDDPQQNWMRIGLTVGLIVVCTAVILLLANSGK